MKEKTAKQVKDIGSVDKGVSEAFDNATRQIDDSREEFKFGKKLQIADVASNLTKNLAKGAVDLKKAFDEQKAIEVGFEVDEALTKKMNAISKAKLSDRLGMMQSVQADMEKEFSKLDGVSEDVRLKAISASKTNITSKMNGLLRDTMGEIKQANQIKVQKTFDLLHNKAADNPDAALANSGKLIEDNITPTPNTCLLYTSPSPRDS